jgi:hypothetical protein
MPRILFILPVFILTWGPAVPAEAVSYSLENGLFNGDVSGRNS